MAERKTRKNVPHLEVPSSLGPTAIAAALRDAKCGGAAGSTGMRTEHLEILLLVYAATRLANAQVPANVVPGGWATIFDRATRLYQFALQARAGTGGPCPSGLR